MVDLAKILERIYQGFVLRDILGFVVPGGISLLSLWIMFHIKIEEIIPRALLRNELSKEWQMIVFIVSSYLLAWTFQCMHYAVLRLIASDCRSQRFFGKFLELRNLVAGANPLIQVAERIEQSDIVTKGALEPDLLVAQTLDRDYLEKRLDGYPYTERLSALMLMTSNLAFATILFVLMINEQDHWQTFWYRLLFLIPLALYVESWRLWQARNIQVAIYAAGSRRRRR